MVGKFCATCTITGYSCFIYDSIVQSTRLCCRYLGGDPDRPGCDPAVGIRSRHRGLGPAALPNSGHSHTVHRRRRVCISKKNWTPAGSDLESGGGFRLQGLDILTAKRVTTLKRAPFWQNFCSVLGELGK